MLNINWNVATFDSELLFKVQLQFVLLEIWAYSEAVEAVSKLGGKIVYTGESQPRTTIYTLSFYLIKKLKIVGIGKANYNVLDKSLTKVPKYWTSGRNF